MNDVSPEVIGRTKVGHIVGRYPEIARLNNNPCAGHLSQPTSVFMIKDTESLSVVPGNPDMVIK